MVREKGLEPPRPKTPDPNSGASAIPPLPHILNNDGSNTFRSPIELIKLAGVAGFEPTNAGVKVRCLTAWRHPKVPYLLAICIMG